MIKVDMPSDIRNQMKEALKRSGPREIGGILMGKEISSGYFKIVDFSLDEISGEEAHFVRDLDHHQRALTEFFDRTGHDYKNFNYLGEWHSHPGFPPHPSASDTCSMQELVDGERSIDFAVLLIVKLGFFRRFISSAFLYTRGGMPEPIYLKNSGLI
jgi:integrative and conjugative element protein (TIGR02256 family)